MKFSKALSFGSKKFKTESTIIAKRLCKVFNLDNYFIGDRPKWVAFVEIMTKEGKIHLNKKHGHIPKELNRAGLMACYDKNTNDVYIYSTVDNIITKVTAYNKVSHKQLNGLLIVSPQELEQLIKEE